MKLLFILLIFFSIDLKAEIAVIGNLDNELKSMTKKEVYMGRTQSLPNGSFALPLDYHELRSSFHNYLTGRPIEQINAYWARIMFSGQASPPMKLQDSEAVIKVVTDNKGAIGYIDKKNVDENIVRILLILK